MDLANFEDSTIEKIGFDTLLYLEWPAEELVNNGRSRMMCVTWAMPIVQTLRYYIPKVQYYLSLSGQIESKAEV